MSELWQVVVLSLLPGAGNFAGGVIAEVWKPSPRLLNWSLHAAAGIVIAIVSVELIPSGLEVLDGWWLALAFAVRRAAVHRASGPRATPSAEGTG
jgi:ZIP family zinc transporter